MGIPSVETYQLKPLGPWDLRGPDGAVVRSLLAQPKRLCLLAYLALNAEPVSRAKIVALFWPESDEERARNALNQAVHYLRRSLSKDAVQSVEGDRLWVPREAVEFDAREVLEGEVELSEGAGAESSLEFFDGWNADDSQPLQEWLDGVRRAVAAVLVRRAAAAAEIAPSEAPGEARDGGGFGDASVATEGYSPATGGRGRHAGLAAAALVATMIALGFGWSQGRASVASVSGPPEVAVLMPSVFAADGAPIVSGDHIHEELVAGLGRNSDAVIQSVRTVRSVSDFVSLLEAQGADDRPEWAVTMSVRIVDGHARVIGMLLRGPDFAETPANRVWDYVVGTDEQALIELPEQIAAGAVAEFGGWLGGGVR